MKRPQSPVYNLFAGQSLDRLAGLSDGVFAVAMTLLVLDLHTPVREAIHTEGDLWRALVALSPRLTAYFLSFLTLGIFWTGQQMQLNQLARGNRDFVWIHLGFLLALSIMPFSTALLAEFITFRIALIVYWLNIFIPGVMLFIGWRYASREKLLRDDVTAAMSAAIERRILVAQTLYAFGALLCVVNTYVSIAAIVLVQLNYAIAPRIRPLYRL